MGGVCALEKVSAPPAGGVRVPFDEAALAWRRTVHLPKGKVVALAPVVRLGPPPQGVQARNEQKTGIQEASASSARNGRC